MKIRNIYTISLLCLALYFSSFYVVRDYNFYSFWENNGSLPSFASLDKIINEFNISKALINRGGVRDSDSINILLSYQDLTAFRDLYHKSININDTYISDADNNWRKAKVNFAGSEKMKTKVKTY